jgi:hypothetical protein
MTAERKSATLAVCRLPEYSSPYWTRWRLASDSPGGGDELDRKSSPIAAMTLPRGRERPRVFQIFGARHQHRGVEQAF